MATYRVHLVAVASCTVEVEAEDSDAAIDAAFEAGLPYADAFAGYDLGEWTTASDLFPDVNKPEDDTSLIGDDE